MSFLSNARRALGGKPTDDEYDNYDSYEDEFEDEEDYADYDDDDKSNKGFFSFLSRKSSKDYNEDKADNEYQKSDRYRDARSTSYSGRSSSYSSRSYSSYNSDSSRNKYSSGAGALASGGVEVTVLYPENFDKCNQIVQDVKAGKITIFDVSGIETVDEARRIVDYICGAAEGMECPFSRLCPSIFCIAPKGVTVTNPKQKFR